MSENVVAITLDNFQQVIIEESKNKLVLVDFWADQVPESLELRDKLISALSDYKEYMVLATVDCQSQQQIAMQFGIQGLPTAVLVKEGQPIDAMSGPQTDPLINEFLAKHLPKEEDLLLEQAKTLMAEGGDAFKVISKAYQLDDQRADIKLVYIDTLLLQGNIELAKTLLNTVMMVDQDSYYQALVAKIDLAEQAADSPELKQLESKLSEQPDNIELVHQLASQYHQVNRNDDALAMLFSVIQKDRQDNATKDLLLDILKALPDSDPLIGVYRRKLYTLMY